MSKALLGQRASGFSAVMQGVSKPGLLSGAASKGSDLPAPWAKARCSQSASPCRQKRKFMNRERQGSGCCQEAGPESAGSLYLGLLLGLSSRRGWSRTRETKLTDSPCAGPGLAYGSMSTGLLVALPSLSKDTRCHQARFPSRGPILGRHTASLGRGGPLQTVSPYFLLQFPAGRPRRRCSLWSRG